ncbi:MAG: urease accessory protein UreD [Candidatus Acidiferrales bacterium]
MAHVTAMTQCRFTLPLQAQAAATQDDGTAYLMMLNPTGGVLGGDRLATEIVVEDGASVCLTTPSATRVYRAAGAPAEQETAIEVGAGASLEYLPDHVIPHSGARLRQRVRIDLACGARAIVLDAMSAGRVARGERWEFAEFDSQVDVRTRGERIFFARTRICPNETAPGALGRMEEFNYMASLGIFADEFGEWRGVGDAMRAELERMPAVQGGASLLGRGGCTVRYIAKSAADLSDATRRLWTAARLLVLGRPAFDLRKY